MNIRKAYSLVNSDDTQSKNDLLGYLNSDSFSLVANEINRADQYNGNSHIDSLFFLFSLNDLSSDTANQMLNREIANTFLRKGANPNVAFGADINSFLAFCCTDDPYYIDLVLNNPYDEAKRADPKHGDSSCHDAAFYTVLSNAVKNYDYLIKNNLTEVNKQFLLLRNNTALHFACLNIATIVRPTINGISIKNDNHSAKKEIIEFLIENGADATIENGNKAVAEELLPFFEGHVTEDMEPIVNAWDAAYELVADLRLRQEKEKEMQKKVNVKDKYQVKF